MIEVESQTMLNTLTDHTSRMYLNWQKRWEQHTRAEGGYFEGDGGQ
jgi:hypothetical protein